MFLRIILNRIKQANQGKSGNKMKRTNKANQEKPVKTKKPKKRPKHYDDIPSTNKWWENRAKGVSKKVGKPPRFESSEQLWKACCEYFQWVEKHPLYEVKAFPYKGTIKKYKLPKKRVMTIQGLTIFLNISVETWRLWKTDLNSIYFAVCKAAENIIYNQKFEGAVSDFFNASIIARDLGLQEKHEVTGKDGKELIPQTKGKIAWDELTEDDLMRVVEIFDKVKTKPE